MRECTYLKAVGIDYRGQFQKIPKSKNKLQPLFEAMTNSIEAIKLGNHSDHDKVTISLSFASEMYSQETNEYKLSKIIFEDTGIGFNDREFKRFQNLHDNSKGSFNRGSGRVQYMHFFGTIEFESIYKDEKSSTGFYKRVFILSKSQPFLENDSIICYHEPIEIEASQTYTKVTFQELLDDEDQELYNQLSVNTLKKEIIIHYLYYFCENRDNLPNMYIKKLLDNNETETEEIDIEDIPKEDKEDEVKIKYKQLSITKQIIEIEKEEIFYIKAFKLNKNILDHNDLRLTSKHEIVEGKIAKRIGLDILKPDDVIENNRYLFLVSSKYIDSNDDDNRGDLKIYTEEEFKKDTSLFTAKEVILLDDIQDKVNSHILTMYDEILEIKNKHELDINKLQKMFLLDPVTLTNIKINVQDTDESILKKVYKEDAKRIAEKDAKIKEQIDKLNELNPATEHYEDDLGAQISSLVKAIPLQNRTALTHAVARRKLVLELFQKILERELKIQNLNQTNIDEKLLHNLIFQQTSDNPDKSDLWLINEDFIYFKGTSEGTLGDIKINGNDILKNKLSEEENTYRLKQSGDAKLKRPDILLFPSEGKCILIEFKAPQVNVSEHLNQLNRYASLINNLSKDEYKFNTFYGYLIGESIDSDDIIDNDSDFINAYNFDYIFRPFKRIIGKFGRENASLYTEVIKYSTLLERAKKRNEIFINKLMGKS